MEKYRLRGQITVLASLVLGILTVLAVVCVKSVVSNMALLQANEAVYLGVESVFSEYVRPLFDRYAVFGFECKEKEEFKQKLEEYMSYNLDYEKGLPVLRSVFFKIQTDATEVTVLKKVSDEEGRIFARQIKEYMLYAAPVQLVESWMPIVTNTNDNQAAQKAYEDYLGVVRYAAQIDEQIMNIIECIDVIRANTIAGQLKRLDTELVLIQAAYYSPESMGMIKDKGFAAILKQIIKDASDLEKRLGQIPQYICEIEQCCEELKKRAQTALEHLDQNRGRLSDILYSAYKEQYEEFVQYQDKIQVIDIERIQEGVESNLDVLHEFSGIEAMKKVKLTISNLQSVSGQIHAWQDVIMKMDYDNLTHSYEGTGYQLSGSENILENIITLIDEGLMGLVVPRDRAVSEKFLSYTGLASESVVLESYADAYNIFSDEDIAGDILFNEYVLDTFCCFTDKAEDGTRSLEYEAEYILNGSRKDKENIQGVISQLVLTRSGFNLACLICDSKRKSEAYGLSSTVLGFTGSYGVITLGQCLVMYSWAYAESVNDVKILLNGGQVAVDKIPANWVMELSDVLTLNFKGGTGQANGLDYKGYLRILLYLCGREKKYYRTMDMVEVGMEDLGYANIRLSQLYSQAVGKVKLNIFGMQYCQEFQYGY